MSMKHRQPASASRILR